MKLIAPAPGTQLAALKHEYTAKPLLSAAEGRLFDLLHRVSDSRVHIACKPRMADFIQHTDGLAGFNAIGMKHVDFLILRREDWTPMFAIELDDATHNQADRKRRDGFVNNLFAHIGIPLLRLPVHEVEHLETLVDNLSNAWFARCRNIQAGSASARK